MSSIFQLIGAKTKTELDKKLNLTGGTLTGALTLSGAPTSNLHAATKAYADGLTSGLQTELDATQAGAGLGTDGSYTANGSANYIASVATLQAADNALDTQVKTNADNIASNATDISNLQTQAGSLAADGNSASFSGNLSAADLTLSGNLTVQGTTTTVDTTNVTIKDSILNVSSGAGNSTNASNDGGFIVERGSSENNAAFIWDEGDDQFKALTTSATAASSDISSTDSSAALATLGVGSLEVDGTELGDYQDFLTGFNNA